ncbi:MAG: hypothetical protein IRY99_25485 [Isosphaeraceae bacterium]|nr:hypothetical protein [Isosphaeraceae bacterium]
MRGRRPRALASAPDDYEPLRRLARNPAAPWLQVRRARIGLASSGGHSHLHGVYLIHDGGPSHIAAATDDYLSSLGNWWRPRRTPAHASWLNQSELLNNAFEGRYLKRGSWPDRWAFIEHVHTLGSEYNHLFAHPFEWTWTNQKRRSWFSKHAT